MFKNKRDGRSKESPSGKDSANDKKYPNGNWHRYAFDHPAAQEIESGNEDRNVYGCEDNYENEGSHAVHGDGISDCDA